MQKWETWVQSLGWKDSLEEGMATHSGILAWRVPCTEESGGLQSRVTKSQTHLKQLSTQHLWSLPITLPSVYTLKRNDVIMIFAFEFSWCLWRSFRGRDKVLSISNVSVLGTGSGTIIWITKMCPKMPAVTLRGSHITVWPLTEKTAHIQECWHLALCSWHTIPGFRRMTPELTKQPSPLIPCNHKGKMLM